LMFLCFSNYHKTSIFPGDGKANVEVPGFHLGAVLPSSKQGGTWLGQGLGRKRRAKKDELLGEGDSHSPAPSITSAFGSTLWGYIQTISRWHLNSLCCVVYLWCWLFPERAFSAHPSHGAHIWISQVKFSAWRGFAELLPSSL
jgi:hypothetical protein